MSDERASGRPDRGRRGRAAPIAVGVVSLLAGIGAAVATVLTSGEVRAGRPTPGEVVDATVAAWRTGNAEAAVGLMPSYQELVAVLDCPRVEDRHGRPSHERARAETWAKARAWAARRPKLATARPGDVTSKDVDEELGRCRTILPFAMQAIDVTVELDGGGHGQFETTLTVAKLGERWFLLDAGGLPSSLQPEYDRLVFERQLRHEARKRDRGPRRGYDYDDDDDDLDLFGKDDDDEDAADTSVWAAIGGPSSAVVAKFRALRDATCACTDLPCIERTDRDLARLNDGYRASEASDDEHRGVSRAMEERAACVRKVRVANVPKTGVPACDDYVAMVEWYMACDKIPQVARDGMDEGLDAMRQAWRDAATMGDDMRAAMADGCRAAADALGQAAQSMGCGTPP